MKIGSALAQLSAFVNIGARKRIGAAFQSGKRTASAPPSSLGFRAVGSGARSMAAISSAERPSMKCTWHGGGMLSFLRGGRNQDRCIVHR